MTSPTSPTSETGARLDLRLTGDIGDHPIAAAWSPDGRRLAVGAAAGGVVLYDLPRAVEVRRWQAHEQGLHQLAWHPSQPVLATSGQDASARLWSVEQDACVLLRDMPAASPWVEQLAWRPDGKQLAYSSGRRVQICAATGDSQRSYEYPDSTVSAIAWRPRGAQLAVAGYGGVLVCDVLDPRSSPRRLSLKGSLTSLAFSPDGQVIAASCQDKSVYFWRLRSGSGATISGFERKPTQLDWSPNSRWLATGGSGTVTLWPFDARGPEGRSPTSLEFHKEPVKAIAFAAGAPWLASACEDGYLCIWRSGTWQMPAYALQMKDAIESIAWGPSSKQPLLAALTRSGHVVIWEVTSTRRWQI